MLSAYLLGTLAAVMVGLAKTGVPGLGILVVPLMANLFPARESVGVLLPMLIWADLFAVAYYRRHTDWGIILRLAPWIAAGLALGAVALQATHGVRFGPILGGLVLGVLALDLVRRKAGWTELPGHPFFTAFMGTLTGIATMMGNVAGPVMSIYLLCLSIRKERFMGSMAWLFLIINVSKVPVFVWQDMITPDSLTFNAFMIVPITLGTLVGKWALPRIPQALFDRVVLCLSALAALKLVFF